MNISVFVPNYRADRLQQLLNPYKNVQFEFFRYDDIEEVLQAYETDAHFLDGYLFSGVLSYRMVKERFGDFEKPVAFLKNSESDFFKRIFHIMLDHPNIDLSRVFIDFDRESTHLQDFIQSLPAHQRPQVIENEPETIDNDVYQYIFRIHKQMHEANQVDLSLTRFANIVDWLEAESYPYYYFEMSSETIHDTLTKLIQEINFHTLKDNQIVCGYLKMENMPADVKEIKLLNLHSSLLDYSRKHHHQI